MASAFLLISVFVLDLIAFGFAVAAERRRSTATLSEDQTFNYCVYDRDIATGFGVAAVLFLLVSQLIVMVASRCLCCGRALRPSGSRACSVVLFLMIWICFLIAEVCLMAASVRNAYHTKYRTYVRQNPPTCETLRKGVFAAGAGFIIITGILSEIYCICYAKAKKNDQPTFDKEPGVRMANL